MLNVIRKKSGKGSLRRIGATLMAAIMLLALIPALSLETVALEERLLVDAPPVHHKHASDNGDGTYNITLDVHGSRRSDINVVLVLDVSTSMQNNRLPALSPVGATKSNYDVLKSTAKIFINHLYDSIESIGNVNSNINVAIVRYAGSGEIVQMWTNDKNALLNQIDSLSTSGLPEGNTNSQAGLYLARLLFTDDTLMGLPTNRPQRMMDASNSVVFMTDGAPNRCYIKGTQTIEKNDASRAESNGANVAQIYADTVENPILTVKNGKIKTEGSALCVQADKTDYRMIAARATFEQAKMIHDLNMDIQMLTVGLGTWFTQTDETSIFPTSINFTRIVGAVGNGFISMEEATAQLGLDVGSGAMPGINPTYPITDYTKFQSGATYSLDTQNTGLSLAALQEKILQYYGDMATQQQDGIYRLKPIERADGSVIDIEAVTEEISFFGDTEAEFLHSFELISNIILSGYVSVDFIDVLSQNVTMVGAPATEEEWNALNPVLSQTLRFATLSSIYNPDFVTVEFYRNIDFVNNPNNENCHMEDYVLEENPPTQGTDYDVQYFKLDAHAEEAGWHSPHEGVALSFAPNYMLPNDMVVKVIFTVRPSQYAIDTLYNNRNNPSFQPLGLALGHYLAQTDGINPDTVAAGPVDTNGYPDQAFEPVFAVDPATGLYNYVLYYPELLPNVLYNEIESHSYTLINGLPQYGFFTNVQTFSDVRFMISNYSYAAAASGEPALSTSAQYHFSDYAMPVIAPELIDLPVEKLWIQSEGMERVPVKITVSWEQDIYNPTIDRGFKRLNISGKETKSQTVVLNAENNWKSVFTGLPQGHSFTITETDMNDVPLAQYASVYQLSSNVNPICMSVTDNILSIGNPAIQNDIGTGLKIYNTELGEKTVTKVWEDDNNAHGVRPDSVAIQLFANGLPCREPVTLVAPAEGGNVWTYTYTDLPLYDVDGVLINYTVAEISDLNSNITPDKYVISESNPGYSSTTDNTTLTITNSLPGYSTDLNVYKLWDDSDNQDGIRPESVEVRLYQNGVLLADETVMLSAADHWHHQWSNLPTWVNGVAVTYTVEETVPDGYVLSSMETVGTSVMLTNQHLLQTRNIEITKVWDDENNRDGLRPLSLSFRLLANGVSILREPLVITAADGWKGVFGNLPMMHNGQPIVYTVEEVVVPGGYTCTMFPAEGITLHELSADASGQITVTNTHVPLSRNITVNKVWRDEVATNRTASVNVNLMANGTVIETVTLNADNNWSYEWTGLPMRAAGTQIRYTVVENPIPTGYVPVYTEVSVDETDAGTGYTLLTITNTTTTQRTVSKVWDDDNNSDGRRPNSVPVRLKQNGVSYKDTVLTANNNWTYTWSELPRYAPDGTEYNYTVEEGHYANSQYYRASYSSEGNTIVITNKQIYKDRELVLIKKWESVEDATGFYVEFDIYCSVYRTLNGERVLEEDDLLLMTIRLDGSERPTPYQWKQLVPYYEDMGDLGILEREYRVVEKSVGIVAGGVDYHTLFNGPITDNQRFFSSNDGNGTYTNRVLMGVAGAQAHIVHEDSSLSTAPLYTDGIRFGVDIDVNALNSLLDVGDKFVYGFLLCPKNNMSVPATEPTIDSVDDYLMRLNIANHRWSMSMDRMAVVYATCIDRKSEELNANTMVVWTQAMEDAANSGNVDGLIDLLSAADCSVYIKASDYSFRTIGYLMFSNNEATRIKQANTTLAFRGFFIRQSADGTTDDVLYTLQRENSAQRIFNHYAYAGWQIGEQVDGWSAYYPARELQAMR